MSADRPADDPSSDAAPPFGFDQWAELSAMQMGLDGRARSAALRHRDVDEASWERSDAHWSGVMREDLLASENGRARIYASFCVRERDRRAAAPAIEGGAPAASAAPEVPAAVDAPKAPAREVEVPTFLAAGATDQPTPGAVPRAPSKAASRPAQRTQVGGSPPRAADLPFVPPREGAPAPKPRHQEHPSTVAVAADRGVGNTVGLAEHGTDAPLPFAPTYAGVELTLEQYASFRAELAVADGKESTVLARYRLTDPVARRALDETWRKRFAKDRPLQKRFIELSTGYRDHLAAALLRQK